MCPGNPELVDFIDGDSVLDFDVTKLSVFTQGIGMTGIEVYDMLRDEYVPEVKRIRFFMTFGQSYLDHMRCLENVGMLSTTPINYNGQEIVPIQFLKALLPDPASIGPRTKGMGIS